MDLSLTKLQKELVEAIRGIADQELRPTALTNSAEKGFKWDAIRSLARLNLVCPTVPKEYGGRGLDLFTTGLVVEEIASVNPGAAAVIAATLHAAEPIILAGTEEQKQSFLPGLTGKKAGLAAFALTEPTGGSDLNAMTSMAVPGQNGYRLNGCKDYVINADVANFTSVIAATDLKTPKPSLRVFVVPDQTPGLTVDHIYNTSGINFARIGRLCFKDAMIEKGNVIKSREAGSGYLLLTQTFDVGRALVSALAVGIARAALEAALHFADQRIQFGTAIKNHQGVAFTLADMATQIEMARLMTWKACWLIDRGGDYSSASAMAKLASSNIAQQVTCAAADIMGARAYERGNLVEQLVRDARVLSTIEGTNNIQKAVIASLL